MTLAEFHLYAALFDAVAAVRAGGDERVSVDCHGNMAGAAVRVWASSRRLDVVPKVLESEAVGGSWTILGVVLPGDDSPRISVHLDDTLYLNTVQSAPTGSVDVEIPF